jgi:hypothetical protein
MTPFLSALVPAAALYGTMDVSAQSEVRVRNAVGVAGAVVDLDTTPDVRVGAHARRWEIIADYAPDFSLLQIGAGAQPGILHHGSVSATYHDRRASISCYEEASYGDQSFTSLSPEPTLAPGPPQLQPIPEAALIKYGASRTGCSAKLPMPRRWVLGTSFEYALSGGLDPSSRADVPFQTGPHGEIDVTYAASRADRVAATLDASRAVFSSGEDDVLLQLTGSWRHAFGRDTESTLSGGAGWAETRDAAALATAPVLYPIATAALEHRLRPARVDAQLSVQLSPVVDRLNGVVSEWLEGMATVTWSPTRALAIEGQLAAVRSIPWAQAGSVSFVFDELTVTYRLSKRVDLRGGARTAWQSTLGADPSPALWVAFAGVTVRAPSLRF